MVLVDQHWNFYADTLGLPDDTARLDVPAPFTAEQLSVRIVREVSTRYRHRDRSLAPIARVIATQYEAARGNYIAFFSSFDYLEQAFEAFSARHPAIPAWRQDRRMDDAEREAFLARFVVGGCGVGFAVLGGSFAEGIDLVGTRLIGAFIATLGLPQFNPINEELRRKLAGAFGAGYDYTYLYPGHSQGRAGRWSGHPDCVGPRQRAPHRRPIRSARGASSATEVVAHRGRRFGAGSARQRTWFGCVRAPKRPEQGLAHAIRTSFPTRGGSAH